MGSVEGLYAEDSISLGDQKLQKFHFLAVEEVHKLGVRFKILDLSIRTTSTTGCWGYLCERIIHPLQGTLSSESCTLK